MTAAELAAALQGRPAGAGWMARCPAHDDRTPSLSIRDGADGRVLVKCFAGCERAAVIDALRARGLWPGRAECHTPDPEAARGREAEKERRKAEATAIARDMWRRSGPAEGTAVERYLAARGYTGPIPPTIRYKPDARHRPTGLILPAMVAAVTAWPGRDVCAVHRTFLTADGRAKAPVEPAKMALGPCKGGAVRLAAAGEMVAIAEGIETGLSVQMATGLPVWAALSAGNIETLVLPDPPLARGVVIFADADPSGRRAALCAAERWAREGRCVRIAEPPEPGTDFNDLLLRPPRTAEDIHDR